MKKILTVFLAVIIAFSSFTGATVVEAAASNKVKTSISKIEGKTKGFKVTWKKKSKIKGYQIQYSTSSKFKKSSTKSKTISKAKVTSTTVSKLKGCNKKYYVRVRTYKVSKGKKVYSSWSKSKKVKTLKHKYSKATCTVAKKCTRCGATSGRALGHKWQNATCKAPKTCSVCKKTEGNKAEHKYISGTCIYCGDKQIINPKIGLKQNADYYYVTEDGDGYYTLIIWQFDGEIICPKSPNGVYSTNQEWKESDETVFYKGKTYYPVGSGGLLPRYYLTDTAIILDYKNYPDLAEGSDLANAEYRLIVNHEYDLEVIYSTNGMFKKGDILDLVE